MNRAAGEKSTVPAGRRVALHHMITAGNRGYGAWRDGGLTIHDISDPGQAHTDLAHQLVAAFSGRHAHAHCLCLAAVWPSLPTKRTPKSARRERFTPSSSTSARRRTPCRSPRLPTPKERDFCALGTFGPHNLHENRPGSVSKRGNHLRDLQQRRGACVRYQGRIRSERDRLLGAADPEAVDRSAAERRARREDRRHLRHDRGSDVRQRLECRAERSAVRRVVLVSWRFWGPASAGPSGVKPCRLGVASWIRLGLTGACP